MASHPPAAVACSHSPGAGGSRLVAGALSESDSARSVRAPVPAAREVTHRLVLLFSNKDPLPAWQLTPCKDPSVRWHCCYRRGRPSVPLLPERARCAWPSRAPPSAVGLPVLWSVVCQPSLRAKASSHTHISACSAPLVSARRATPRRAAPEQPPDNRSIRVAKRQGLSCGPSLIWVTACCGVNRTLLMHPG